MTIQSGGGLISGIPTQDLINQLLQLEARPKTLMQRRIVQLQSQQAAFLDLNSRIGTLRSASSAFRLQGVFQAMSAASSNAEAIGATANKDAIPGSYSFIVDRLVTTQQMLTRGFADRNTQPLGLSSFTVEDAKASLTRDVRLADLNGGAGVQRGKFTITQDGQTKTIDLSKAANMSEVLDAINESGLDVQADLVDGSLRLRASAGGASFTVNDQSGGRTASDLGILGSSADAGGSEQIQSGRLLRIGRETSLASLNDGNGVFTNRLVSETRTDFRIDVGGTIVNVNIGSVYQLIDDKLTAVEGPARTVGGVLDRINSALDAAGISGVAAEIDPDGTGLRIRDTTGDDRSITMLPRVGAPAGESTLRDLGFASGATGSGSVNGSRVVGGLGTTLTRNLNGGKGISGDLIIAARDGTILSIDTTGAQTVDELLERINNAAGNDGRIVASLSQTGSGLRINDTTGATAINLFVGGEAGEALGLATGQPGVDATEVSGSAKRAFVSAATALNTFNNGRDFQDARMRISDGSGKAFTVRVTSEIRTVGQLINEINSLANGNDANVVAELNDRGDGIVIREKIPDGGVQGGLRIKVEDESGNAARALGIAGEAKSTGEGNFINGGRARTIEFEETDTLEDMVKKMNEAGAGLRATIVNDGGSANPFRLSLVSTRTGADGRFLLDTGGFDLGLQTMEAGQDARVFFGGTDPAKAVLITSRTNTLDQAITGVTLDLKQASDEVVTVTVNKNTGEVEKQVEAFVKAFNDLITRIDTVTKYDQESETKGVLLGDSTTLNLRRALFSAVQSPPDGFSGTFTRLSQVGVKIGAGGKLEFDADRFRLALEEDPEAVEALFTRRDLTDAGRTQDLFDADGNVIGSVTNPDAKPSFSALGIIGKIEELADRYASAAGGVMTQKRETIDSQIRLQQQRISAFDVRLASKRQVLEAQFLQMERAIASLQSQQSSLGAISSIGFGF